MKSEPKLWVMRRQRKRMCSWFFFLLLFTFLVPGKLFLAILGSQLMNLCTFVMLHLEWPQSKLSFPGAKPWGGRESGVCLRNKQVNVLSFKMSLGGFFLFACSCWSMKVQECIGSERIIFPVRWNKKDHLDDPSFSSEHHVKPIALRDSGPYLSLFSAEVLVLSRCFNKQMDFS